MHAHAISQKCFEEVFRQMHAARVRALTQAVLALLNSRRRDLKSARYGCAFHHSLTRKAPRIAILLPLHASRAHYSVVRIGWESLRRGPPPLSALLLQLTPQSTAQWFVAALRLAA